MSTYNWVAKVLILMPLVILQGCGPSGGGEGSNEAPRILDVHTVVEAFSDHEAESNMTLRTYFHVKDANGIDDIEYARVTFPNGTTYTLSATNRLFERNGEHYMRGYFYMPTTGNAGEKSFAMHGYKVEVVDGLGASKTQIFSITEEGGDTASTGTRIVHPDDYTPGMSNAYSAFKAPVVYGVTVFSDGVQVDVDITDNRARELQFYFADAEGEWFAGIIETDSDELTITGRCTYSVPLASINMDDGFGLSDIAEVEVTTFDPGTLEAGPFMHWSYLSSVAYTTSISQDAGTVPEDVCGSS